MAPPSPAPTYRGLEGEFEGRVGELCSPTLPSTNPPKRKKLASGGQFFYIFIDMITIVVILHIVVCLALIFIVLLQHGKGAGIGAAFGGSSQTVFGSTGAAPFLAKLTAAAAIVFMVTSLGLTFLGRQKEVSVMQGVGKPGAGQTAPAIPGEKAPPPAGQK